LAGALPLRQPPPTQTCPVVQAFPQRPQLARSLWKLAQRAVAPVPQRLWPVGQAQAPAVQVWPLAQAVPQRPQLLLLVWVLTQVVPQRV